MKKSKFLKKSLAMLLALMLVVAMIPLSAAAASPSLSYLYVDGVSIANNGGTFEVDAHYESTGVDLSYAAGALNYGTKAGSLVVVKNGSSATEPGITTDKNFDFATSATSSANSTGPTTWPLTPRPLHAAQQPGGVRAEPVVAVQKLKVFPTRLIQRIVAGGGDSCVGLVDHADPRGLPRVLVTDGPGVVLAAVVH